MNNSKKVEEKCSKKINGKSSRRFYSRSNKAITLIALIVTIIVLLILAGVTINLAVNNQGIFNKAKTATGAFKNASDNEQTGLDEANKEIAKYMPKGASEGESGSESSGGTSESGNSGSGTSESGSSGSVTTGSETTVPGSTILRKNAPNISVEGLKYADLDGDGIADGIIVADISKDSNDKATYQGGNPWNNFSGNEYEDGYFFSYKPVTSGLREYSEDTSYKYTNADGSTANGTLIKCTNNTGISRYYVLSLADYDANRHYWYNNACDKMSDYSTFTSKDFGKGKENTEKLIDRMKNHSDKSKYGDVDYGEETTGPNADIWYIIKDKAKEGWFVPSKAEWAAFGSYLNTPEPTAEEDSLKNYGLNFFYWMSSQFNSNCAYYVNFSCRSTGGCYSVNSIFEPILLRLATTF